MSSLLAIPVPPSRLYCSVHSNPVNPALTRHLSSLEFFSAGEGDVEISEDDEGPAVLEPLLSIYITKSLEGTEDAFIQLHAAASIPAGSCVSHALYDLHVYKDELNLKLREYPLEHAIWLAGGEDPELRTYFEEDLAKAVSSLSGTAPYETRITVAADKGLLDGSLAIAQARGDLVLCTEQHGGRRISPDAEETDEAREGETDGGETTASDPGEDTPAETDEDEDAASDDDAEVGRSDASDQLEEDAGWFFVNARNHQSDSEPGGPANPAA